jgi:WhiB family redox-sensing transcriptional regulator
MKKAVMTLSTDALPCRADPELWFAETPADLERAKALCAQCPARLVCLAVAIDRKEVAGVWGGHIIERGRIVPRKRARGRPRKDAPKHLYAQHAPTPQPGASSGVPGSVVHLAAQRLYEAECALHDAYTSGVDAWVASATEKLHGAVVDYLAALEARRDHRAGSVNPMRGRRALHAVDARRPAARRRRRASR